MAALGVPPYDIGYAGPYRTHEEPAVAEGVRVSLAGTVAAVGLWLSVGSVAYLAAALVVLFYFPSVDRLPSGTAADAAYVLTVPLVLALTWLAAVRNRS